MSLINDMLNDLDARRAREQRDEVNLDWMSGQKVTRKNSWMMPVVITASICGLLALGYGFWRLQTQADLAAVEKLESISVAKQSSSAAQAKAVQEIAEPTAAEQDDGNAITLSEAVSATKRSMTKRPAIKSLDKQDIIQNQTMDESLAVNSLVKQAEPGVPAVPAEPKAPIAESAMKKAAVQGATKQHASKESGSLVSVKTVRPLTVSQQDLQQYKQAQALIRKRQLLVAEQQLIDFLATAPQAARSAELLASLWLSQGRYDKVAELLDTLATYQVTSVGLRKVEARLLLAQGEKEQAVALLMTAKPLIDQYPDYYELLGLAAQQSEQYTLSAETYRGLLAFDSSKGDWWVGLAIALDMQKMTGAAKEAYRHGLQSKSISPALRQYAQQRLQ